MIASSTSRPDSSANRACLQHTFVVTGHDRRERRRVSRPVGEDGLGHHRTSLGIVAFHDGPQLDGILCGQRLDVDHLGVDQRMVQIQNVGHAAGHASGEVPPGRAEHGHASAGHVLAPMVTDAFDNRDRTGVADTEPLAHPATQEQLTRRRSIEDGVAGDDVLLGNERRGLMWTDDDSPAGQPFADVVVGVAVQPQRDPRWKERAEGLARGAGEHDLDGVVGQALAAERASHLRAEHGAHGPVDVADRQLDPDWLPVGERTLGQLDQRVVQRLVQAVTADLLITLPDALVRVVGEVVELAVPLDADLGGVLSTLAADRAAGIGIGVRPGALVVSLRQARSALPASRLRGRHMHAEEIASSRLLLNAVGPQTLQAYADAVLGPLDATDRADELMRALAAFLEHNGHWAAAATALRVHRHTMNNRINAVERLTGRRMESAQDRHELWLALRARDAARMSSEPAVQ